MKTVNDFPSINERPPEGQRGDGTCFRIMIVDGQESYLLVRKMDECRPDIISYRAYGTQNYWWFICWYNGYMDIWNDITENQIVKYPALQKVRDFLKWRLSKTKDNRNKE